MADRTLAISVLFKGIEQLTAPLRRIGGASKETGAALADARKEQRALNQQMARVSGYRDQQAAIAKTHAEMDVARGRVRALREQIAATDGPVDQLTREMTRASLRSERLEETLGGQTRKLDALGQELRDAGIGTGNLAREETRLATSLDDVNARVDEQKRRYAGLMDQRRKAAKMAELGGQMQSGGTKAIAGGIAVAAPLALAGREAIAFEESMADVRKVVSGTAQEMAALDRDIINMSKRLPMAAKDIAAIVASGGQAGIERSQLGQFAEDATKMGIAFDATAEDAGSMMATWRTAFAIGRDEVVTLADKINYLGDNSTAKVGNIADIVTRIGALGEVAGMASGEVAAIGATVSGMGVDSERSATGIKNMFLALTKGEAATNAQRGAFAAIGLDAEKVSKAMQVDGKGTILDVLQRIRNLNPERQSAILTQLFGSESIAAIAPMLTQLDTLRKNLDLVGDSGAYAGSMQREFDARAATTANRLQLMTNRVDAAKIKLGNALLPTIAAVAERLGNLADRFSDFADRNPKLAKAIMLGLAALAALLIVFGAIAIVIGTLLGPIAMLGLAFSGPASKANFLVRGLRILWVVLKALFSPIQWIMRGLMIAFAAIAAFVGLPVWIVAAIAAALAAAAYLIISNWDAIAGFFSQVGNRIKAGIATAVNWMRGLPTVFQVIGRNMLQGLLNALSPVALVAHVMKLGKSAVTAIKGVLGIRSPSRVFAGIGDDIMGGLGRGLDRSADAPIRRIRRAGAQLTGALAIGAMSVAPAGAQSAAAGLSIGEIHIHLVQQPGEDGTAFAQRVRAELEKIQRNQRARDDSSYEDRD